MSADRYFDNAATTPPDTRVVQAFIETATSDYGNSSSIHALGSRAHSLVESARLQVAKLVGAEAPEEIVFTSGATESNNWVLSRHARVAVSSIEHSSLWEPAQSEHTLIPYLDRASDQAFDLFCLMRVNNETGLIYGGDSGQEWSVSSTKLHVDLTQAVGKIPVNVSKEPIAFASLSAHKFYGMKGAGALYAQGGAFPSPFHMGGQQEFGARAGTVNVSAIVAMGVAAEIAIDEQQKDFDHAVELGNILLDVLGPVDIVTAQQKSPFILNIGFEDVQGENLVTELDQRGFAISSGAACSSRSAEPSHVLTAMGYEENRIRGSIRISFGRSNTRESAYQLGLSIQECLECLRKLAR